MQIRTLTALALIFLAYWEEAHAASGGLRGGQRSIETERELEGSYYHTLTTSVLGKANPDAAIGNPLKGLVESPVYTIPPYKVDLPLAVEFYYLDFDKIMKGNPNVVGEAKAFNWTYLDETLIGSASRNMHAAWRVTLYFPGQPHKVPQYLIDAGVELRWNSAGEQAPVYNDAKLLEAMEQFIRYSGKRYDGDKRLGYLQAGLLGKWGEWHDEDGFLTDETKQSVTRWYAAAYTKTQTQVRFPSKAAYDAGLGLHDDSFAFETIRDITRGVAEQLHYFWPSVLALKQGDVWKKAAIGGEVRPELATSIFESTAGRQNFMRCVEQTHTSWLFQHAVWKDNDGQGMRDEELAAARSSHARMGYNFHVERVAAKTASAGQVDLDVTIKQIGVAPFYYDLSLALTCSGMSKKVVGGIDSLIDQGSSMVVSYRGVPATAECLKALTLGLESSYAYTGRPIKLAQGNGALTVAIPLPRASPQPVLSATTTAGTVPTKSPPATVPRPALPVTGVSVPAAPAAAPTSASQSSAEHCLMAKVLNKLRQIFKLGKR